jgi:NADPH:quinone reductase-like Zn-dependent oxidoreductase
MVTGTSRSIWAAAKTWWAINSYNPLSLMPENKMAGGYHLGYLSEEIDLIRETCLALLELYKEGKIKPVIDSQWSFDEVRMASRLAQNHFINFEFGKNYTML